MHGGTAGNGNPTRTEYGFECPQRVPGYDCVRWGSNMTLVNTSWSPLGDFRQGGSIGFDGVRSYGLVEQRAAPVTTWRPATVLSAIVVVTLIRCPGLDVNDDV